MQNDYFVAIESGGTPCTDLPNPYGPSPSMVAVFEDSTKKEVARIVFGEHVVAASFSDGENRMTLWTGPGTIVTPRGSGHAWIVNSPQYGDSGGFSVGTGRRPTSDTTLARTNMWKTPDSVATVRVETFPSFNKGSITGFATQNHTGSCYAAAHPGGHPWPTGGGNAVLINLRSRSLALKTHPSENCAPSVASFSLIGPTDNTILGWLQVRDNGLRWALLSPAGDVVASSVIGPPNRGSMPGFPSNWSRAYILMSDRDGAVLGVGGAENPNPVASIPLKSILNPKTGIAGIAFISVAPTPPNVAQIALEIESVVSGTDPEDTLRTHNPEPIVAAGVTVQFQPY